MSLCPNRNTPEWKALENNPKIGQFEALRDWMENDHIVRSPELVIEKLEIRKLEKSSIPRPVAVKPLTPVAEIEQMLVDSKAIRRHKKLLFIKQHSYPEALKAMAAINKKYGPGTVSKTEVKDTKGAKGRTVFRVVVNTPLITEPTKKTPDQEANEELSLFIRRTDYVPINLDPKADDAVASLEMIRKMSEALGVSFEILDAAQAKDIEPNWKGEVGFYKRNNVYFVGPAITTGTAFHEFSHPFVRAILNENPKLFNTLYAKLAATPEGAGIIADVEKNYKEHPAGSNLFKEEVLVQGLTIEALNRKQEVESGNAFIKAIKDLLYAIKQFLRKTFGKGIKIEKLKADTTLKDLADILVKGGKLNLTVRPVTESEIAAYKKHTLEDIKHMEDISDNSMVQIIDLMSKEAFKWFMTLAKDKRYAAPARALGIEESELEQVKTILANYRTNGNEEQFQRKLELLREKVGRRAQQAGALLSSMALIQDAAEKTDKDLKTLSEDLDNKGNLTQIIYYKRFIDDWIQNSNAIIQILQDQGVPAINPVYKQITLNKSIFEGSQKYLSDIFATNTFSVMKNILGTLKNSIDEYYTKKRADYVKKGATEKSLKQLDEAYEKDKLTDKKYWDIIKGSGTDANRFSSYMEGYMNNQDPAILGLTGYINKGIHEYLSAIQSNANDIKLELIPLLEKANWNRSKISSLAEKVIYTDATFVRNRETGKLERKEVLVYLNEFLEYTADERQMILDIEDLEKVIQEENHPADSQSRKDLRQKRDDFATWRTNYMHQEKIPAYYARYDVFKNTDLRREAKQEMDEFYEDRNIYERELFDEGFTEIEEDAQWEAYQAKERQLFNEYYTDGKKKEGDELEKVKIRKEYRAISRDMNDYILIPNAFENAREQYQQKLIDAGITKEDPITEEQYTEAMALWDKRNTRVKLKKDPADELKRITDRLRELNSKLDPAYKGKNDLEIPFDIINDIERQHKDASFNTIGEDLSKGEAEVLKENQEAINHSRRILKTKQRLLLTEMEEIEYDDLNEQLQLLRGKVPTEYYLDAFNGFLNNRNGTQPSLDRLINLIKAGSINKTTADIVLDEDSPDPNKTTNSVIKGLFKDSPGFEEWFRANHVVKTVYDTVARDGSTREEWERLYAWTVKEHIDPDAYETIEIKDDEGKVIETLQGAPAIRYYKRMVKKEFLTGYDPATGEVNLVVGKHIDNRQRWLPRTVEDGAKDDKYRNKAYYELKESTKPDDQANFALLEGIKKQSLKIQEGLDNSNKLWYDHPRFEMSNLEIAQNKDLKEVTTSAWKSFLSLFKDRADNQEDGYNADVTDGVNETITNTVIDQKISILDNNMDLRLATVGGTYKIDIDRVSKDIPAALLKYMAHATRNKKFQQMLPTAVAFEQVFKDPERAKRELQGASENMWLNNSFGNLLDKNVRAKAISFLINREFRKQVLTGFGADNKTFNAIINAMFGRASLSFFALNVPGALQNQFGPIFQGVTESFSGKYWNPKNLGVGVTWGFKTMGEMSTNLTSPKVKPLGLQIAEVFDMAAGNYEKAIGESMSRMIAKDAMGMSWLLSFRKWTETQATMVLGAATLDHIILDQKMPDGTVKQVAYLNAWETDAQGKIKLLDGINPEFAPSAITHEVVTGDTLAGLAKRYSVTEARIKELNELTTSGLLVGDNLKISNADEFSKVRSVIHEVSRRNQGAYSTFELAQVNSDTLARIVLFMKKWFIPMFMDRWAFKGSIMKARPRYNLGTGEFTQGTYITLLHHILESLQNLNIKMLWTSPEVDNGLTKRAYVKIITDVGLLIAMTLLYQALFGWDPNDKDRYEKLRKKSGGLPSPFAVDDPRHPFKTSGFLANHALSLMMRIRNENEQLLPVPGLGLDNYANMLSLKSYVMGPTIDAVINVTNDATQMLLGNDNAYYKKAVGTYAWQQAGAPKILNHAAVAFGFNNKDMYPQLKVKAIEDAARMAGNRK